MITDKNKVITSELLQTGESLRKRYEEKKKPELVVERKPVRSAIRVLGYIRVAICVILALIGAFSFLHPQLRNAFILLVKAFLMETGLL